MSAAGGDIIYFFYMGGDQKVPERVTHVIIHPSVKSVRRWAFKDRRRLVSVIFHDGVEIIEGFAFYYCKSLRRIKLLGVREIRDCAFDNCSALSDVEFGDRLETIGCGAFARCKSLRSIKSLSVRTVEDDAFSRCEQLTDVEFGINLERIGVGSFKNCPKLQRIVIPLKGDLFSPDPADRRYTQFDNCVNLTRVDLVGAEGIRNTISSLHLKSSRDKMNQEIDRINQELLNTPVKFERKFNSFSCSCDDKKTDAIRLWSTTNC